MTATTQSVCAICGGTEGGLVIAFGEWRVLRCPKCDLGRLDPKPDMASQQYGEEYFAEHRIMTAGTDDELARKIAGQRSRVNFIKRYKPSGQLLDIGCASGYFLARAREEGYGVHGIEVSEWAVQEGRSRLGLEIDKGNTDDVDFPDGSFDIITMWHVIEHVEQPIEALSEVRRWLKQDGLLVIECPNMDSFDARRCGKDWRGWSIPYHLWHYTPASLAMMLQRSGYEVLHTEKLRSQWIRDTLRRVPIVGLLRNPISSLFSGRDMRMVARPAKGSQQ